MKEKMGAKRPKSLVFNIFQYAIVRNKRIKIMIDSYYFISHGWLFRWTGDLTINYSLTGSFRENK